MSSSMNNNNNKSAKMLVLVGVALGCVLAARTSEARGGLGAAAEQQLTQDEIMNYERSIQEAQQQLANGQQQFPSLGAGAAASLDRLDSDDDDDDDDRVQLQPGSTDPTSAGSDVYQTGQASAYQPPLSVGDLRTAASKHHHGHHHGAKGWLDMGAWTGKKGAFGWYDKHPVGKGK